MFTSKLHYTIETTVTEFSVTLMGTVGEVVSPLSMSKKVNGLIVSGMVPANVTAEQWSRNTIAGWAIRDGKNEPRFMRFVDNCGFPK